MGRPRTLLVAGQCGVGKTALIRRFVGDEWSRGMSPTIGLDEDAGAKSFTLETEGLVDELRALLPEDGLELRLWEIGGGHGGHLRQVPRGQPIDGLLLCYSVFDRASFQNVAHRLMQHRTDRHLDFGASSLVASSSAPPRLPVVICGMRVDEADGGRPRAVTEAEAQAFARANGVRQALTTSAKTGELVQEAFQALALAVLEAEEEAEAERLVAARAPPASSAWGLGRGGGCGILTSPPGARPREPGRGMGGHAVQLVEAIDAEGTAFGARTLAACLERGLRHRAVHVWLGDPCTGGLLLRRYAASAPKLAERWGPTCCGEVLCYGSTADADTGPHTSELSVTAASRVMREMGVDRSPDELEHWFSCASRSGKCNELLDVYVATLRGGSLPQLRLWPGEEVEWVHYLDVFGSEPQESSNLFHIEASYRRSMAQKMCARIVHADLERPAAPAGLATGRPSGALPVG